MFLLNHHKHLFSKVAANMLFTVEYKYQIYDYCNELSNSICMCLFNNTETFNIHSKLKKKIKFIIKETLNYFSSSIHKCNL